MLKSMYDSIEMFVIIKSHLAAKGGEAIVAWQLLLGSAFFNLALYQIYICASQVDSILDTIASSDINNIKHRDNLLFVERSFSTTRANFIDNLVDNFDYLISLQAGAPMSDTLREVVVALYVNTRGLILINKLFVVMFECPPEKVAFYRIPTLSPQDLLHNIKTRGRKCEAQIPPEYLENLRLTLETSTFSRLEHIGRMEPMLVTVEASCGFPETEIVLNNYNFPQKTDAENVRGVGLGRIF